MAKRNETKKLHNHIIEDDKIKKGSKARAVREEYNKINHGDSDIILLKDMVENKTQLDKKEQYNFRFNKRLMDYLKSYAKLKGVTTTDIIITAIENELDDVVAIREELNHPVPVYKDYKRKDDFLGYVNWNNFLDRWNGYTYCYDNDSKEHKGISSITFNDKKEYVLIQNIFENVYYQNEELDTENIRKGTPENYIGTIITKNEAIQYIISGRHFDLFDVFPELKKELTEEGIKRMDDSKKYNLDEVIPNIKHITNKDDLYLTGCNKITVKPLVEENEELKDRLAKIEENFKILTPEMLAKLRKLVNEEPEN